MKIILNLLRGSIKVIQASKHIYKDLMKELTIKTSSITRSSHSSQFNLLTL